jgi:hypothetical protein
MTVMDFSWSTAGFPLSFSGFSPAIDSLVTPQHNVVIGIHHLKIFIYNHAFSEQ